MFHMYGGSEKQFDKLIMNLEEIIKIKGKHDVSESC